MVFDVAVVHLGNNIAAFGVDIVTGLIAGRPSRQAAIKMAAFVPRRSDSRKLLRFCPASEATIVTR
ncbi:hypothetical protein Micbo1qcDRAFT_158280, partial [Microdochium bolleyi]